MCPRFGCEFGYDDGCLGRLCRPFSGLPALSETCNNLCCFDLGIFSFLLLRVCTCELLFHTGSVQILWMTRFGKPAAMQIGFGPFWPKVICG